MCCPLDDSPPSVGKRKSAASGVGKLPRRRVTFDRGVHVLDQADCGFTAEERQRLWYQKSDYREFKSSANQLSRQARRSAKSLSKDFCLRGLERRISTMRQRLKTIAIRDVLSAQADGRTAHYIAMVAQESNAWATTLAIEAGTNDYNAAHRPHLLEDDATVLEMLLEDNHVDDDDDEKENLPEERCESPSFLTRRKRKRTVIAAPQDSSPPPRKRREHPMKKVSSLPSGEWRRRRVPMWTPESWVAA